MPFNLELSPIEQLAAGMEEGFRNGLLTLPGARHDKVLSQRISPAWREECRDARL